jgi:hypothetical protein
MMGKALLYAMETIRALPPERQDWSDMKDVVALFNERFGFCERMRWGILAHMRGTQTERELGPPDAGCGQTIERP